MRRREIIAFLGGVTIVALEKMDLRCRNGKANREEGKCCTI
jgi:hypothetical protein